MKEKRRHRMKSKLIAILMIMMALLLAVACTVEPAPDKTPDDDDTDITIPGGDDEKPGTEPETELTNEEKAAFASYMEAFGHVRVLGDIDHVLRGEKVDDETGVTVQSMTAGEIAFDINRTELAIPLSLTAYDYDGHRNPDDPAPEKYTRTATGTLTLVLTGAATAEGTSFVATGYRIENADITLAVDDSTYIWLDLPEMTAEAEKLAGIFTTAGGVARSSVSVMITDGKASGIADVDTPKFGKPSGTITLNGKAF